MRPIATILALSVLHGALAASVPGEILFAERHPGRDYASPKEDLPELRKKRPPNYPKGAKSIDKAITAIEASTDAPKPVTLKEFIANTVKSNPQKKTSNQ